MEAVLPIEIEMGSLRVALEQKIFKVEWAQSHYDQLSLLDERSSRSCSSLSEEDDPCIQKNSQGQEVSKRRPSLESP